MDDATPATKADITELRHDMDRWKEELLAHVGNWKQEITQHFDVVAENLAKDFQDAFRDGWELLKDKQTDHDRRIKRLERRAGLIA